MANFNTSFAITISFINTAASNRVLRPPPVSSSSRASSLASQPFFVPNVTFYSSAKAHVAAMKPLSHPSNLPGVGNEQQDASGERHLTIWLPTMAAGRDGRTAAIGTAQSFPEPSENSRFNEFSHKSGAVTPPRIHPFIHQLSPLMTFGT